MNGYPKQLKTKQDYLNVISMFPKEKWEGDIKALISSEKVWKCTGVIESGDGVTDDMHEVVENNGKKYQMEAKIVTNKRMDELGITEEEVNKWLL